MPNYYCIRVQVLLLFILTLKQQRLVSFKPYENYSLVNKLMDTNKRWKDSLYTTVGNFDIPYLNNRPTFTQMNKNCRVFEAQFFIVYFVMSQLVTFCLQYDGRK